MVHFDRLVTHANARLSVEGCRPDADYGGFVDGKVEVFEANRGHLFGLAYRLLGDASEAEDAVQDTFLRWERTEGVRAPAAWLTTVLTRLCLTRLTSARARREVYVGQWLPEPVLTGGGALGPMDTVTQRESVSLGMLSLLERLTPPERAVFVLREAFGYPHAEVAEMLAVTEEQSRQLLTRARHHVGERRRFEHDPAQHAVLVQRFLAACAKGNVADLQRLLAADVVAWADGGGRLAARRPILGADKVARYMAGLWRRPEADEVQALTVEVNGQLAQLILRNDEALCIVAADFADGLLTELRLVVSPDKLRFAASHMR